MQTSSWSLIMLAWRGKYVGWYRIIEDKFCELIPQLTEVEIKEHVTAEDWFIAPTIYDNQKSIDKKHPPTLAFALRDDFIILQVIYNSRKSVNHFLNIFHDDVNTEKKRLFQSLKELNSEFHSILYTYNKEKNRKTIKNYLSNKLDEKLVQMLIDEAERLRKGGRQIVNNQSIYIPPQSPIWAILEVKISLNEQDFREKLDIIKPLYEILLNIKTRREIIKSKLNKSEEKVNKYRELVDLLNEARKRSLISAQRRRELEKRWRDYKDEQLEIIDELKKLIAD